MTLSPEWLAGFFDGEGSIVLSRVGGPGKFSKAPEARLQVCVCIVNTNKPIIDAIFSQYGGNLTTNSNHKRDNCQVAYIWRSWGPVAARFLGDIEPHLLLKRQRAVAAMFYFDSVAWPKVWRNLSGEARHLRRVAFRALVASPNTRGTGLTGSQIAIAAEVAAMGQ